MRDMWLKNDIKILGKGLSFTVKTVSHWCYVIYVTDSSEASYKSLIVIFITFLPLDFTRYFEIDTHTNALRICNVTIK